MSNATHLGSRALVRLMALLFVVLFSTQTKAATHTIVFGVDGQLVYSPSELTVAVGDIITWEGDFSLHPLRFTAVPVGASVPNDVTTGTSFSYTVEVAGAYNYVCVFHGSMGMTGSFTTGTASVSEEDVASMAVWPNPASKMLRIELAENASEALTITFCDTKSHCVTMSTTPFLSGSHRLEIGLAHIGLVPGVYMVTLETDKWSYRRKIVIE